MRQQSALKDLRKGGQQNEIKLKLLNNLIKGDQQNKDEVKPLKNLRKGDQQHEHKLKPLSNLNGEEQIERELKLFMNLRYVCYVEETISCQNYEVLVVKLERLELAPVLERNERYPFVFFKITNKSKSFRFTSILNYTQIFNIKAAN